MFTLYYIWFCPCFSIYIFPARKKRAAPLWPCPFFFLKFATFISALDYTSCLYWLKFLRSSYLIVQWWNLLFSLSLRYFCISLLRKMRSSLLLVSPFILMPRCPVRIIYHLRFNPFHWSLSSRFFKLSSCGSSSDQRMRRVWCGINAAKHGVSSFPIGITSCRTHFLFLIRQYHRIHLLSILFWKLFERILELCIIHKQFWNFVHSLVKWSDLTSQ